MTADRPALSRQSEGRLAHWGLAIANWTERWFPDPFVFALLGVAVVFVIGMAVGETPASLAIQAGKSFWSLVPFTMQMVMVIIGGYVVSSTPAVSRAIRALAKIPKTPRGAVAMVAFLSMLSSLISWGLSLVFSGLFVKELVRHVKGLDYRAAGAAGFLGIGTVWALGLSSSAALLMATKSALPPTLMAISGIIPLSQTIFLWPSLVMTLVLMAASVTVAYFSTPSAEKAKTVAHFGIDPPENRSDPDGPKRPGDWLENSPLLTITTGLVLCAYLVNVFRTSPQGALVALDLNTYNLIFLTAGLLLQWRPRRFIRAVTECVPGTAGILIQFPIYAMIFGLIVGTGLSEKAARLFVSVSTHSTYPLLVTMYSALLGVFIPSGGSKWIIESPYVLQAAIQHHVHLGWVVQIYNASEALPNLINPFYMLPILAILRLRARDLVGYTILQLGTQVPIVFFLCWLFAQFIPFVPPAPAP